LVGSYFLGAIQGQPLVVDLESLAAYREGDMVKIIWQEYIFYRFKAEKKRLKDSL